MKIFLVRSFVAENGYLFFARTMKIIHFLNLFLFVVSLGIAKGVRKKNQNSMQTGWEVYLMVDNYGYIH